VLPIVRDIQRTGATAVRAVTEAPKAFANPYSLEALTRFLACSYFWSCRAVIPTASASAFCLVP